MVVFLLSWVLAINGFVFTGRCSPTHSGLVLVDSCVLALLFHALAWSQLDHGCILIGFDWAPIGPAGFCWSVGLD